VDGNSNLGKEKKKKEKKTARSHKSGFDRANGSKGGGGGGRSIPARSIRPGKGGAHQIHQTAAAFTLEKKRRKKGKKRGRPARENMSLQKKWASREEGKKEKTAIPAHHFSTKNTSERRGKGNRFRQAWSAYRLRKGEKKKKRDWEVRSVSVTDGKKRSAAHKSATEKKEENGKLACLNLAGPEMFEMEERGGGGGELRVSARFTSRGKKREGCSSGSITASCSYLIDRRKEGRLWRFPSNQIGYGWEGGEKGP